MPRSLSSFLSSAAPITTASATSIQSPIALELEKPMTTQKGFELDEWQKAAVHGLAREQFGCLIGAAGTGKTTVENVLIQILRWQFEKLDRYGVYEGDAPQNAEQAARFHRSIACVAYTGRAVQQIKKALPREYHSSCMTIHKMLEYGPEFYDHWNAEKGYYEEKMRFIPKRTHMNRLPYSIIIIDEAGMVPIKLWNEIEDALSHGTRVFMVGDINQLPPVHGKSIFGFAMLNWPTFELKQIHRQAQDNPIIANAHRILNGQQPVRVVGKFDIASGNKIPSGAIGMANLIVSTVKTLATNGTFDPKQDAIILPQNIGHMGQTEINEALVPFFNPDGERISIHTGRGHALFAVGDKVMNTRNDPQNGITNGMVGEIVDIIRNGNYNGKHFGRLDIEGDDVNWEMLDETTLTLSALGDLENEETERDAEKLDGQESQNQSSHIVYVKFYDENFPDPIPFRTAGDFANLQFAYAFTCHKSQGGEYRNVIIVCHSANSRLLTREWLYTAVTRARERVFLIANDLGLIDALRKQKIKGITLEEKIKSFQDWQPKDQDAEPRLPGRNQLIAA